MIGRLHACDAVMSSSVMCRWAEVGVDLQAQGALGGGEEERKKEMEKEKNHVA